jgi:hypothetical protein
VSEPWLSAFYPDIAAHGSLALAMQDLAATHGLELGSVRPSPLPGWVRCAAVLESEAANVELSLGMQDRVVMASCWRRGVMLASGGTPEMLRAARAAEAFLGGDSLADLHDHHSFMTLSDLALAFEAGTEVEAKWQQMIAHPEWEMSPLPVHRMVLAAAEQPVLRVLFPFTSHDVLCFSRCTGYPYTWDLPKIEPTEAGSYRVWDGGTNPNLRAGRLLADGVDVREAVATLVAALPDDCRPAIPGTADNLGS